MPPGIPVATMALNGSRNAGILAAQILATGDETIMARIIEFKADMEKKIVKANKDLSEIKFEYKTN